MRDRGADHRHGDQVLLRRFDRLTDGLRHLARLPQPGADAPVLVADDDQRAEGKAAAALDHLRHAVQVDDLLCEFRLASAVLVTHTLPSRTSIRRRGQPRPALRYDRDKENRRDRRPPSLYPTSGRARQRPCRRPRRLPPPTATSGFCEDRRRWSTQPPGCAPTRHRSAARRRGADSGRSRAAAASDRPRGGSAAEYAGGYAWRGDWGSCSLLRGSGGGLPGLARLAADPLAAVEDALAFVRFGRTDLPHFGGDLADNFLAGALDVDAGRLGHVDRDPFGHRVADRMRVADTDDQRIALAGGAVADPNQLELLLVTLADAFDHVPDQRPGEPMQRAMQLRLTRPLDDDRPVLDR